MLEAKWSGQRAPDTFTGIPALSYKMSSSVFKQSNLTTPTAISLCLRASIVFKIILVLPEEGGPEKISPSSSNSSFSITAAIES